MHRADRRRVHIRIEPGQLSLIFGAPQLGLSCFKRTICVSIWKGSGWRGGRAGAAVGKPFQTDFVVAREDLVAGLARDAELTAQHRIFSPSNSRAMNLSRSNRGFSLAACAK